MVKSMLKIIVFVPLMDKPTFLDVPSLTDVIVSVEVRGMYLYSAFQLMISLKQPPLR